MNHCDIILDLLPLYVDDAVSAGSRQFVEEHIRTCENCRRSLAALRAPVPAPMPAQPAAAPDEAGFLIRLRRKMSAAVAAGLVLLVLTGVGATEYGRWSRNRELDRQATAQRQEQTAALAAVRALTPDPVGVLKSYGVSLSASARRSDQSSIRVSYSASMEANNGIDYLAPAMSETGPTLTIRDPRTGESLKASDSGGHSSWGDRKGSGEQVLSGAPAGPVVVNMEWPVLEAYRKVDAPARWAVQRPGPTGEVAVGGRVTVQGVEFEVTRVVFGADRVRVEYRQLTDPAKVGVHFLVVGLSDGVHFWGERLLDGLSDPQHPYREFRGITSPSNSWTVSVDYAVLTVPGVQMSLPVE